MTSDNWSTRVWVWIGLAALLVFAASLRTFHMDYPSLGYHNMKENELLSQTLHFYEEGPSIRKVVHHAAGWSDPA